MPKPAGEQELIDAVDRLTNSVNDLTMVVGDFFVWNQDLFYLGIYHALRIMVVGIIIGAIASTIRNKSGR
jgi:hypothetical protein